MGTEITDTKIYVFFALAKNKGLAIKIFKQESDLKPYMLNFKKHICRGRIEYYNQSAIDFWEFINNNRGFQWETILSEQY